MISGQQTLAAIDGTLIEARGKAEGVEAQIASLSARLVEQQQAQAQDYRDLARVRVDLLGGGKLVQHIDAAEQQVVALLSQRAAAAAALGQRLQAAEPERQALEQERAAQAGQVDAAAQAVDAAEARTQARLEADPGYQAQRERAHEAERTARHADDKAARSEQEKDDKGKSYRDDPLFMYLWSRRFGRPEYRASGLIRWLDGKVARLIGFADARANYERLNEIPPRLREHADRLKAAAEAEFAALKKLDLAARETDGIPPLEQQVQQEQARLDAIDQRLEESHTDRQELLAQQAAFASGEDEFTRKAIEYLAAEFQRDDLMELRREALATPFPDDDLIVSRILQREDERRQLEASLQSLKDTLQQQRQRLGELEALSADFRRNRYDRSGSMFGDDALIALMLSNFLNGLLDRQTLWRIIQQQQRYQPPQSDPWFGSGGFGRGTVWNGGLGDLGDLGDIIGRMGRGGRGGGFGGGGGGGGFRTGGGF